MDSCMKNRSCYDCGAVKSKHTVCEGHVKGERGSAATKHFTVLTRLSDPAHVKLFLTSYKSGHMKLRPMRTKSICTPKIPMDWRLPQSLLAPLKFLLSEDCDLLSQIYCQN